MSFTAILGMEKQLVQKERDVTQAQVREDDEEPVNSSTITRRQDNNQGERWSTQRKNIKA